MCLEGVRRRELVGAILGIVLLWYGTVAFVVLNIFEDNYDRVFIYDGCLGKGSVTIFIFCLLEVIVGAWFIRKYLLPLLFNPVWTTFDSLKQQKLIGFIAQIVVRTACAAQLVTIMFGGWGPQLTLETGLFAKHNAREAYNKLLDTKVPTSCKDDGMDHLDVAAMRSWYLTKYHMVAVHIWELAFIPGLTLDGWLHHLFVILVAALASQPEAPTGNFTDQPFLDSIGFSFILGASLNCIVKSCVVMYHFTAPRYLTQARWMEASIAGATIILLTLYMGFPLAFLGFHFHRIGIETTVICIVAIAFLSFVEGRLIFVKRSIARAARKKATPVLVTESAVNLDTLIPSPDHVSVDAATSPCFTAPQPGSPVSVLESPVVSAHSSGNMHARPSAHSSSNSHQRNPASFMALIDHIEDLPVDVKEAQC